MKIALSTHLLAYRAFHPSFPELIRGAGFSAAEIWCMCPHFDYRDLGFVEETKGRLERAGVEVPSVHLPFYFAQDLRDREHLSPLHPDSRAREHALQEGEKAVVAARALGATVAVLHLGEPGAKLTVENEALALAAIERLGRFGAERGVGIALENILSDLTAVGSLRDLIRRAGLTNVGICLDVGHSRVGGDPARDAREASGWLLETHLHDNDGRSDQHRPPGEGSIDWAELTQAFRDSGYQGWHNLEIRDESRGVAAPGPLLRWAAEAIERVIPRQKGSTTW